MSKENDGHAAFPRAASEFTESGTLHDGNDAIEQQDGMSLRDYFAGQALVGIHASEESLRGCAKASKEEGLPAALVIAATAYYMADQMLKARKE